MARHCAEYEAAIAAAGGIDLQLLGIGRTGHVGFNEPGSGRASRTRLVALSRVTRRDASSAFLGVEHVPRLAVTVGVGTILSARRLMLVAWGEDKAAAVAAAVEGAVSEQLPASYLQLHPAAQVVVDEAAAAELTRVKTPWLVASVDRQQPLPDYLSWQTSTSAAHAGVVSAAGEKPHERSPPPRGLLPWPSRVDFSGDSMLLRRAVIWLCRRLRKPILKLTEDDYIENGLAELLLLQPPPPLPLSLLLPLHQHQQTSGAVTSGGGGSAVEIAASTGSDGHHGETAASGAVTAAASTAYDINVRVFRQMQATITGWPGGKPQQHKPIKLLSQVSQQMQQQPATTSHAAARQPAAAEPAAGIPAVAAASYGAATAPAGSALMSSPSSLQEARSAASTAASRRLNVLGTPLDAAAYDSAYPKRILVFSPHPDDDVISCGGTLLRLVDQGHVVHVAYQVSHQSCV